jgi:hypothetical protein
MSGWIKHGIDACSLHLLKFIVSNLSASPTTATVLSSVFTFGVKTRLSIKPGPEVHWAEEKINRCFSYEFCEFLHVIPVNSTLVSLPLRSAPFNKFIIINLISVKRRCRLDGIPLSRRPFGAPMINFGFILFLISIQARNMGRDNGSCMLDAGSSR